MQKRTTNNLTNLSITHDSTDQSYSYREKLFDLSFNVIKFFCHIRKSVGNLIFKTILELDPTSLF